MTQSIAAVILVKKISTDIEDTIISLGWCSEIILIIDSDKKIDVFDINKFRKLKIIYNKLKNSFSSQRNKALGLTSCDWVFFIDDDEKMTEELKKDIIKKIDENNDFDSYYVQRRDRIFSKILRFGENLNFSLVRLGRRSSGKWIGAVHEKWETNNPGMLDGYLIHDSYKNIGEFISKIDTYSDLRAGELFNTHKRISFFGILFFTAGKFIYLYLIKFGFLDGIEGFISAACMSFYSFMVRAKMYFLYKSSDSVSK